MAHEKFEEAKIKGVWTKEYRYNINDGWYEPIQKDEPRGNGFTYISTVGDSVEHRMEELSWSDLLQDNRYPKDSSNVTLSSASNSVDKAVKVAQNSTPIPVEMYGNYAMDIPTENVHLLPIGAPARLEAMLYVNSTTSFESQKENKIEIDIAKVLQGATVLTAPSLFRNGYGFKVYAAFVGLLVAPIENQYILTLKYGFKHRSAPNDPYDGLTWFFSVDISGFKLSQWFNRLYQPRIFPELEDKAKEEEDWGLL